MNGTREALALLSALLSASGTLLLLGCLAITRGDSARHPLIAAAVAAVPAAGPVGAGALLLTILTGEPVAVLAGASALAAALLWRRTVVTPWRNATKRATGRDMARHLPTASAVTPSSSHETGPSAAASVEPRRTLRLTMVNLLYTNGRHDDVCERIAQEDADIVVTVETDRVMLEHLQEASGWRLLAQGTGDRGGMVVVWTRRDDASSGRPLELVDGAMPSATLELPDRAGTGKRSVRLTGIHLAAPTRPDQLRRWERELADIRNQGLEAAEDAQSMPWILAGDFNASLAHPGFRRLSEVFVDGATDCGRPLIATWPIAAINQGSGRRIPFFNLDHILVSPCLQVSDLRLSRWPGTDHMALTATITSRV